METNIYDRSWGRQRLTKLEFWEYFHRASHTIKITHMWRRWGTPQNYCLAFIDELEKQLFIKKCWILIHNFFLKKKDTCRYYYFTPVYQKSWWYDLQFLRYRVWQTEFWQIELWKNEKKKKFPEISSFYTCVAKTTIIRDMVAEIGSQTDRTFCYFGLFFALSPT